jgi:hypothetical protein
VETNSRKSWKNSWRVCRDKLKDDKLKGVICSRRKGSREAPNENVKIEKAGTY